MVVLATAVVSSVACGSKKQNTRGPAAPGVTVAVAEQQAVPISIEAIGNAQPYRMVQIKSLVDGQITRVLFQQGQDVQAGQLLFQLDKRPFQAALDQALGKLAQDKANAAFNQAQAARDKALAQAGVIAPQVLQQQEALAQSSVAAVHADEAAVEDARVRLGYTDIKAPISARAGAILVNLGNLVKANDTNPLTTLNQITPLYVQFNVPEAQLPQVQVKGIARVRVKAAPPNASAAASTGTLSFVDNAVDATTGTIKLMATFPNQDRQLWPGEFLKVQILLGSEPHAVVVPASALQTGPQGKYVYVVQQDGTAVMRSVNSSRTYRQLAVIENGVNAGDRVIVEGQIKVIPNGKVEVVRTVPVTAAPEQVAQQTAGADTGGRQ